MKHINKILLLLLFSITFSCTDETETFDCTDCDNVIGKTLSFLDDTNYLINDCTIVEDLVLGEDFTFDIIRYSEEGKTIVENLGIYTLEGCLLTLSVVDKTKIWTNSNCTAYTSIFSPVNYIQAKNDNPTVINLVNMACESVLIGFKTFKIE